MLVRPIVKSIVGKITGAIRDSFFGREGSSTNVLNLPLQKDRYGTTNATLSRASAGTVTDFEGIVRTCLPHEFRFKGARRVEELILNPISLSGWSVANGASISGQNITFPATDNGDAFIAQTLSDGKPKSDFRYTARIRKISGTSTQVMLQFWRGSVATTYNEPVSITTEWQLVSALFDEYPPIDPPAIYSIGFSNGTFGAMEVEVDYISVTDVTDQANQSPSDIVTPNDSATSGADIPVRYFDTTNGNTVDVNGVVTEAAGVALTTIDGLLIEEASTNLFLNDTGTQDITVTATAYTVSVSGTGSITLSGAMTGVATAGSPVTATATAGLLTCTVAGDIGIGQVENKSYATSFMPTTNAAATRLADDVQAVWPSGLVNDFVLGCDAITKIEISKYYYQVGDSATNRLFTYLAGGGTDTVNATCVIGGVTKNVFGYSITDDVSINIKVRKSATQGLARWIDNANKGEDVTVTANFVPGANLQIGARSAGSNQLNGTIKNINIRQGDLPDWEVLGEPSPIGILPVFHALTADPVTKEMVGVKTGVGDLSTVCATPHHALDHEDVYRQFPVNSPVWSGGRVVKNVLKYSNKLDNSPDWGLNTGVTIEELVGEAPNGENVYRVTYADSSTWQGIIQDHVHPDNTRVICSAYLRQVPGYMSTVYARNYGTLNITSEWKRYTWAFLSHLYSAHEFMLTVSAAFQGIEQKLDICLAQYEVVSGQSDTTTPSEYIPTTTTAVTKVFACENGNTVLNDVVTEKKGKALVELPYLDYVPAATNGLLHSATFAAPWTPTNAAVVVSTQTTPFPGVAAYTLKEDTANSSHRMYQAIVAPIGDYTCVFYAKQFTAGRNVKIELLSSSTVAYVTVDLSNGDILNSSGPVEVIAETDGWYRISAQGSRTSSSTVYPQFMVTNGTVVAYLGDGSSGIYVSQAETYLNKTIAEVRGLPPVFTEGTAVSTLRTAYTFDDANHAADLGAYHMELIPGEWSTGYLLTLTDSPLYFTGSRYRTLDAGGNSSYTAAVGSLGYSQFGIVYSTSENKQVLFSDGTENNEVAFSGFRALTGVLEIGDASTNASFKIRELLRYSIPQYKTGRYIVQDIQDTLSSDNDIIDLTVGEG